MAHYESPHQDLRCLQIQLFSSLVLKELNKQKRTGILCFTHSVSASVTVQKSPDQIKYSSNYLYYRTTCHEHRF